MQRLSLCRSCPLYVETTLLSMLEQRQLVIQHCNIYCYICYQQKVLLLLCLQVHKLYYCSFKVLMLQVKYITIIAFFLPADGGWSQWNSWSSCAGKCAKGFRVRSRSCYPARGDNCKGDNTETESCKPYSECKF